MRCHIGVNPIVWSNDDLQELGGETPLEVCLHEAHTAGYVGIELGHKFPRRADLLAPLLHAHGLALVSGWHSMHLCERDAASELAAMEQHLALLSALGCHVVIVAETSAAIHGQMDVALSQRPVLDASAWRRLAERLGELGKRVAEQGLQLAYHHHLGTVVQSQAEVERLVQDTPPEVGLLLDTGHLYYAGGDPLFIAQQYGARVVHFHAKDVRTDVVEEVRTRDVSFLQAVVAGAFTVPGDGGIDYVPILSALRAAGYRGWLVVEADQDPRKAHPLTFATRGHMALRHAAISAGLA